CKEQRVRTFARTVDPFAVRLEAVEWTIRHVSPHAAVYIQLVCLVQRLRMTRGVERFESAETPLQQRSVRRRRRHPTVHAKADGLAKMIGIVLHGYAMTG